MTAGVLCVASEFTQDRHGSGDGGLVLSGRHFLVDTVVVDSQPTIMVFPSPAGIGPLPPLAPAW